MNLFLIKKGDVWMIAKGEVNSLNFSFEGVVLYTHTLNKVFVTDSFDMKVYFNFDISILIENKDQFLKVKEQMLEEIYNDEEWDHFDRENQNEEFESVLKCAKEMFNLTKKESSLDTKRDEDDEEFG